MSEVPNWAGRVRVDGRSWVVGGGTPASPADPAGELEAPPFELFRALTGRRSWPQIAALAWSVDPEPWLDAFTYGPFTLAPNDLVE